MDKTETYIRQCEKAEEIQALWAISEGDWYIDTVTFPNDRILEVLGGHPDWDYDTGERKYFAENQRRSFWLPRQDQLQEMLIGKWLNISVFFNGATVYSGYKDGIGLGDFTSMEQLWLAFVMKEKYNKIWDGKEWIK